MNAFGENANGFPTLPILSPAEIPPRKTEREKYGGLFYLGIAGLVFMLGLVALFAHGVWTLRDVGANIFVLNDASRPESERVTAASYLSRDSRLDDEHKKGMSLERDLPELARYLLAESVRADAVAGDPRTYALTVARSPGWPNWLRLLLARPLAPAAARGYGIPREALDELSANSDPMIALWATAATALVPGADPAALKSLEQAASAAGPNQELAGLLLAAVRAPNVAEQSAWDEATHWLRTHHHEAANIWKGWREVDGRFQKQ